MAKATATQTTFQFATKDAPVKKLGIMYVPWSKLTVLENFNDREDYGTTEEMHELAESIYQTGPRVPLKGYKDGNTYVVIVGHRRFRAGEMIKKKYGKNIIFPFVPYSPQTTKKDMLIDTLLTNSGKDLTPLEKASTVSKLIAEKVATRDIAASLGGVSEVYVKNLNRLSGIPENAKQLIRDGVVSATYVMGYLKNKNANMESFVLEVMEAAKLADKEGKGKKGKKKKQAKVTAKQGFSSWKEFRRYAKTQTEVFENKAKQETFEFMVKIANNKLKYEDILDYFTGK